MFTADNTEGYTARQLARLNSELAAILAKIDPADTDAREAAKKAFSDAVARRTDPG